MGSAYEGLVLIGSAEPFTLDRNLNVLKHTNHFSFFISRRKLRNDGTGASQAVRHHVRYCGRLRT
jgi:hypothetical protein